MLAGRRVVSRVDLVHGTDRVGQPSHSALIWVVLEENLSGFHRLDGLDVALHPVVTGETAEES